MSFGKFSLSMVSMFRVTAGMGWTEGLPAISPDGNINWGAFVFLTSYIVIVNWTLLQVSHPPPFPTQATRIEIRVLLQPHAIAFKLLSVRRVEPKQV